MFASDNLKLISLRVHCWRRTVQICCTFLQRMVNTALADAIKMDKAVGAETIDLDGRCNPQAW